MDGLAELITAPAQPWDALICTSAAVKDNVLRVLQAQMEYLRDRLGAVRFPLPLLPVIPLGLHAEDFAFTPQERVQARKALNIDDDALVVLFVGRLTFHAKAHPLAMYQALERAAALSGKSVTLIECGWPPNPQVGKAYADAAKLACPNVRVVTLDGLEAAARHTAWAGADVFCSLADNIQETFGITPIEAMAARLPVVVSDWDGYKDTVRDRRRRLPHPDGNAPCGNGRRPCAAPCARSRYLRPILRLRLFAYGGGRAGGRPSFRPSVSISGPSSADGSRRSPGSCVRGLRLVGDHSSVRGAVGAFE